MSLVRNADLEKPAMRLLVGEKKFSACGLAFTVTVYTAENHVDYDDANNSSVYKRIHYRALPTTLSNLLCFTCGRYP